MNTISNYQNPYENMPLPKTPERIKIGNLVFEEVTVKNGKIVFPKSLEYDRPLFVNELKPNINITKSNKKIAKPNRLNNMLKNTMKVIKSILLIA